MRVLRMNGIDQGIAPALIANVGDAWAFLPGFAAADHRGGDERCTPPARRLGHVHARRLRPQRSGTHSRKVKFSPFTLPEHGRAIVSTVPLTTKDVFGSGTENGEVTLRLQFTQTVSNVGLFFNYCTPSLPLNAYRFGNMQEVSRDLDLIKYEQLVTGRDALPEPSCALHVGRQRDGSLRVHDASRQGERHASRVNARSVRGRTQTAHAGGDVGETSVHGDAARRHFLLSVVSEVVVCGIFRVCGVAHLLRNAPMMFTPLGENKSKLIGSVDVAKAPPGSTLSPLSSLIVAARKVSPRSTPSNDAYETIVQISFWCQAQVEFMREPMENFAALLTWEDEGQSSKYQTMLLGAAAGFVFVPFRFVLAALIFVCLRHPWVAKIPLPPYKVALAKAIAPAPAA